MSVDNDVIIMESFTSLGMFIYGNVSYFLFRVIFYFSFTID